MKYYTFEEIKELCKNLAEYIKDKAKENNIVLVGVARGGLIPAVIIANILNIKDIKIAKISSYSDKTKEKNEFKDNTTDEIVDSENNFFIEDIVDTGDTVKYLKNKFPKSNFISILSKIKIDFVHTVLNVDSKEWVVFPWEK